MGGKVSERVWNVGGTLTGGIVSERKVGMNTIVTLLTTLVMHRTSFRSHGMDISPHIKSLSEGRSHGSDGTRHV